MNKYKRIGCVLFSALILNACQQKKSDIKQIPQIDLNQSYKNASITLFHARPATATMMGIDAELSGGHSKNRLDDYSVQSEAALRKSLADINNELNQSGKQDGNKAVMQNLIRYFSGNKDFPIGYIDTWMGHSAFIVNQINGPLIDVPNIMATNHSINDLTDANDYINRLEHFDVFVKGVNQKFSADTEQGWIPPLVIVNKSISAMQSFIAPKPNNHPLYTSFIEKLRSVDGMTKNQKRQLTAQVLQLVKAKVYPGYTAVINQLEGLKSKATQESGIWAQPNGEAFYQDAVKMLGDTDLSPEEIHQLGLSEVERITKEMDSILRAQGLTKGSVGDRMIAINDDPQFLYEDSDAGRQNLLDDINGYIKEISGLMDSQFASRPKYQVEVRKFPKSREESAPGGMYTNPQLDGSQPGIYWINLRDIKANPKFDLKTLTYHEAIPGHHWQIALNLEQDSLPMLRRIAPYNAYVEGWALYSEKVAEEMGLYKNDPYSDLGRLKAELFRSVRLVVDTGLHYKKWSREQAIKYMAQTAGMVESDVVAEVERYMVWPGQALGYKLGMIEMLRLRDSAQKQLGNKFDIKAFHDLVLLGGAVPMSVLKTKVSDWIESQR